MRLTSRIAIVPLVLTLAVAQSVNAADAKKPSGLNAREAVEAFLAGALSGDTKAIDAQSAPRTAVAKQAREMKSLLQGDSINVVSVQAGEADGRQAALAITEKVKLKSKNPDGGDSGILVLTLERQNGHWLVNDIDLESDESVKGEVKRFLARYPNAKPVTSDVIPLFDGKTLKGWKSTEFGGEGEVRVKDGLLYLDVGSDLTGITWQGPRKLPKTNYEISLDAMRVDGFDFFCGLTVPVKEEFCSLIIGGWGGGVCGISCIDGYDASENDTTTYREFKSKQWYPIRLRVTDTRIRAWIGKDEILDQDIRDKKINVRVEVELSRPLGFSAWQTTAALRKIQVRKLSDKEIKAEAATQEPQ